MPDDNKSMTNNPAFMIAVLGAGAVALIALVISFSEGATAPVVASGPDSVEVGEETVTELTSDTAIPEDAEPVIELSGDAVTPDETDAFVEEGATEQAAIDTDGETVDPDATNEMLAVDEANMVDTEAAEGQEDVAMDMATPSGLTTDLVNDPDNGMKGGPDPDGGAASFYPTPSGPEGRDGDPLTTE